MKKIDIHQTISILANIGVIAGIVFRGAIMIGKPYFLGTLALSSGTLFLASGQILAQGAGAQAGLLEEIVVTARRREESLQDTPLSIAALTADEMQTQGIYYANEMAEFIPSVTLNEWHRGQTIVFIRGIGGGHPDAGFSWGSGIYEDGHYIQFGRSGYGSTTDIERIEVLRGPQGTLFGRNTTGGAVNIISTKPQPDFESEVTARFGDFGQQDLRGMINFPISENVFARLSASTEEADGYYFNRTLGHDQGAMDRTSVRAAFRFTPANWTIDAVLASTRQNDEDYGGQCAPGIRGVPWDGRAGAHPLAFAYGEPSGSFTFANGLTRSSNQDVADAACNAILAEGEFVAGNELETFLNIDIDSAFVTARWDADGAVGGLENVSVTTSLSRREMKNVNLLDGDRASLPIFYVAAHSGQTSETTSLEVLFEADANDRLSFLLGANYFESDTDNARGPDCFDFWKANYDPVADNTITCPHGNGVTLGLFPLRGTVAPQLPFGPGPAFIAASRYDESVAVFGHMTYALNERWDLELGIRHTEDDQHLINAEWIPSNYTIPVSTGCCVYDRIQNASTFNFSTDHKGSFDGTTPKISLTRNLEGAGNLDSGMVYFLISQGYLTGGFNVEVRPLAEAFRNYGPEEVTNYEAGFKGTFGGGRMRLNSAIFYMDYQDKQVEIELDNSLGQFGGQNPTLGVFQNAASVAVSGIEVELASVPWDGGALSASLGYLNTEYQEFSSLNEDGDFVELSNTDIADESPEWTLNASVQHTFTLGNGGTLTPMLGVYWQSELDWLGLLFDSGSPTGLTRFQGDIPGNLCFDDGYAKFRARLTYDSPGGNYSTSLFGRNITDETILDRCELDFGLFDYRFEQPATWGIEFTARWGNNN